MFRFTIRELLLITAIAGLGLAWWFDHQRFIVAQNRLDDIVGELASRNLTVDIDEDGIWISNP
jgi:hypothetical protein